MAIAAKERFRALGEELKLIRTPLYEAHLQDGAKVIDFGGWAMPVNYPNGIKAEHLTVRNTVGIFDLSHMGEVEIKGKQATEFIDGLVTNDVRRIEQEQCLYTCMCRENGHIIDDLIVYRFLDQNDGTPYYWLVVNATNHDKDVKWIMEAGEAFRREHGQEGLDIEDLSMATALVAIQGPKAQETLQKFTQTDLESIGYYHLRRGDFQGLEAVISRTGYTGEDGFEIYIPWDKAELVWKPLREVGCEPIGLGARDTLRLEAGYSLYGHEINEETNPINTSLGWVVRLKDRQFNGHDALQAQKDSGAETAIVGLVMQGKVIPRQGYEVTDTAGSTVGHVTSGTFSPSLGRGIALALVDVAHKAPGTELMVKVRTRLEPALVKRPPFVETHVRR